MGDHTTPQPGQPGGACIRRPGAVSTRCRCSPECAAIDLRYRKHAAARHHQGVQTRVPARVVRRVVADLRAAVPGASVHDVARAAGVPPRTLSGIVNDRADTGHASVHVLNALTRITGADLTAPFSVPAFPTRRMLDALMVAGWELTYLAARIGVRRTSLNYQPGDSCAADCAERVAALYEQLRGVPGESQRTTTRARNIGYAPGHAWAGSMTNPRTPLDVAGMIDTGWAQRMVDRYAPFGAAILTGTRSDVA